MYVWFPLVVGSVSFSAQDPSLWFPRTDPFGTERRRCRLAVSAVLVNSCFPIWGLRASSLIQSRWHIPRTLSPHWWEPEWWAQGGEMGRKVDPLPQHTRILNSCLEWGLGLALLGYLTGCNESLLTRCDLFFPLLFYWLYAVFTSLCIAWMMVINLKCFLAGWGKAEWSDSPLSALSSVTLSFIF